jgi:23S rRNA pseudouridine1911/1915/1917 synthase
LSDARETRRVDTYLSALFSDKSRSYIQRLIDAGDVYVNGVSIRKNTKIYHKNHIRIEWRVGRGKFEAEDIPLEIVYDGPGFAVVNKPAGMNVHPVPGEQGHTGTLVNALLYHFGSLSVINGVERPGIVHRLDKNTSGLLLIAKEDRAMWALQKKIEKRTIAKRYLAVVIGEIRDPEIYIESFIGRDPTDRKIMTVTDPLNPKLAQTRAYVREVRNGLTLVEVDLLTGRTHQIRVHLASIGYPILGDTVYGRAATNKIFLEKHGLTRQWLHAWHLDFTLW